MNNGDRESVAVIHCEFISRVAAQIKSLTEE